MLHGQRIVAHNAALGSKSGQVVETTHDTFRSGRVGLWTKAGSVTCFDDVTAEPR
jgi:hypothetical protein